MMMTMVKKSTGMKMNVAVTGIAMDGMIERQKHKKEKLLRQKLLNDSWISPFDLVHVRDSKSPEK